MIDIPVHPLDNTALPVGIRPVVAAPNGLRERHIKLLWRDIEMSGDVVLSYHRDARSMLHIGREDAPLFGAFDPERTYATTAFGLVASRNGAPLATLTIAIYTLGSYDLAGFLETFGMFENGPEITLANPARAVATGVRGTAAFSGNLWIDKEHRKSPLSKRISPQLGELGRAIGYGTLDCPHSFFFMRDRIIQRGVDTVVQCREPGVTWSGEERWIGYSGTRYMLESAVRAVDGGAAMPAARH